MTIEIGKDTKFRGKLRQAGGSFIVTLHPALVEYLGIAPGDDIVWVAEEHEKYGRVAGFGKLQCAPEETVDEEG